MRYCWCVGWTGVSLVGISWLLFVLGFGMWSIFAGLVLSKFNTVAVRLYWGRILLGFGFWYWVRMVLLPTLMLIVVVLAGGLCVQMMMCESFLRVLVTTGVCEALLIPGCWFFVLNREEKAFVRQKFAGILKRIAS